MSKQKKEQPDEKRQAAIRRRVLIAAAAVAVVIAVIWLALDAWTQPPKLPDTPAAPAPSQSGDASSSGVEDWEVEAPDIAMSGRREGIYTFLVAGKDVVGGGTDTMLLLSYDTVNKTISGLNLPRDTMVNTSSKINPRLNAVYTYNMGRDKETQVEKGMTALKNQVAKLTGIMPDYYVLVEWDAIGELVEAIGGVEFEVPFRMKYDDPYQNPPLHIDQEPGLRLLSGEDAMEVIRWRQNNDGSHSAGGDIARLSIQQDFLKAVAKKCLQPATFLKIPALAEIFAQNVKTDLTVGNILAFARLAAGMDPDESVTFQTAPIAKAFMHWNGSMNLALITLDAKGILEIVNESMNPYQRDVGRSDLQVIIRNGDGSYSVTSGALENPGLAAAGAGIKPAPPKPEEPEDPEDPEEPENPEEPEDQENPPARPEEPGPGQTGEPGAAEPGQEGPEGEQLPEVPDPLQTPEDPLGPGGAGEELARDPEDREQTETGTGYPEGIPDWMIPPAA